ncbi:ShET2/EspL2 family type III secretion system effector toxin [Noviherbaspirillum galbum]|uniref:ShET2/EspL2 family type III secretion system effector toxin n=1 Tax=Noviherbaspirillum galbum TaxID=2709383 RepID=A0A6B3SRG9_9BURK|nr:ShET2/EspL2 family type III secretion system effector toxin [Noviherbaspirillum galbum]NEX63118.1 ShET2/EspL2 family type III secretion system effector toxin [Noviherbaspirillum galbum]
MLPPVFYHRPLSGSTSSSPPSGTPLDFAHRSPADSAIAARSFYDELNARLIGLPDALAHGDRRHIYAIKSLCEPVGAPARDALAEYFHANSNQLSDAILNAVICSRADALRAYGSLVRMADLRGFMLPKVLNRLLCNQAIHGRICDNRTAQAYHQLFFKQRPHRFSGERYAPPELSLNRQITMDNVEIVCRHFVTFLVRSIGQGMAPKACYSLMGRSQDMKKAFAEVGMEKLEEELEDILRDSASLQFSCKRFGGLLHDLAASVGKEGPSTFILASFVHEPAGLEGHLMALVMSRDADIMRIDVYDPNVTGNAMHLKCRTDKLSRLGSFELGDFIDRQALQIYCGDHGVMSIVQVDGEFARSRAASYLAGDLPTRIGAVRDALILQNNRLLQTLAEEPAEPELHSVLAEHARSISSGLAMALMHGNVDGIRACHTWLARLAPLTSELKQALRDPRDGGDATLFLALTEENADAVMAYFDLVNRLADGEPRVFAEMLGKTNDEGTSLPDWALRENQPEAITAYGRVIRHAGITDPGLLASLLPARTPSDTPSAAYSAYAALYVSTKAGASD